MANSKLPSILDIAVGDGEVCFGIAESSTPLGLHNEADKKHVTNLAQAYSLDNHAGLIHNEGE